MVLATAIRARNLRLQWGAEERLTSGWWVLLSLLAPPLALFHSLRYEFFFMVGNILLDKVPPGCSVLSTHFPGLRLNVVFLSENIVALPGPASGLFPEQSFQKNNRFGWR